MTKARTKPAMPTISFLSEENDEPAVPTAERLSAANDNFVINKATGAYHVLDTPCERLHKQGRLSDPQLAAAKQYYADWYAAGLAPLGAVDYERPMVDGATPRSESDYRLGALARWNGARAELGKLGEVVDRVVLLEQSLTDAGEVAGLRGESQRRAVAGYVLPIALEILAVRYRLVGR